MASSLQFLLSFLSSSGPRLPIHLSNYGPVLNYTPSSLTSTTSAPGTHWMYSIQSSWGRNFSPCDDCFFFILSTLITLLLMVTFKSGSLQSSSLTSRVLRGAGGKGDSYWDSCQQDDGGSGMLPGAEGSSFIWPSDLGLPRVTVSLGSRHGWRSSSLCGSLIGLSLGCIGGGANW